MGSAENIEGCIVIGPWGVRVGKEWSYRPEGFISKIIIKSSGPCIASIAFQINCIKGETQSLVFGGDEFDDTDSVRLDYPNEYLMSISGTFDGYGWNTMNSVSFKTNKRSYGEYGNPCAPNATKFSYDCKSGVIVGFHGRANKHVTAIGVYLMPESFVFGPSSHELSASMPKMVMPRDAGPWGAGGGKPWDDGLFTTIKQVRVHLGELNVIYALQFEYMKRDAKPVSSLIHGRTDGSKIELVNLDVKDEYVIGISGYYGPVGGYNGLEAITSISFHTNKRIHGPYGEERGAGYVSFSSTSSSGKVVGFHGRDNGFLSAIGVHMEYF